jgi:rod shape determining protein RodA
VDVGYFGEDRTQRIMRERVQDQWMDRYAPMRHLDPVLVLAALGLAGLGILMIYSAKFHALELAGQPTGTFATRQAISLGIGVIAMIAAAVVDYRYFRAYSLVIYLAAIFGLGLVLSPLGVEVNGQQAWLALGGFQFQPSEFAKVAVIIAVAALLHERREEPGIGTVAMALAVVAPPLGLILLQPDPGTMTVFVFTVFVLLLVAGIRAVYLWLLSAAGVAGIVAVIRLELLEAHQVARLTSFLDPGNSEFARTIRYNADQSLIAIGSGQFFGKGLFNGTQTNLSYVPENHTDFIFTVVGEELGFVGAVIVLGLFALLLWRGLRIAMMAKDRFGMLLAAGTVGLLSFQLFVNVGMTIGIMPVIGIPLPFVSYGGTSLIASFALVGILLNVHMRRF